MRPEVAAMVLASLPGLFAAAAAATRHLCDAVSADHGREGRTWSTWHDSPRGWAPTGPRAFP
jgi:hypothetical protein